MRFEINDKGMQIHDTDEDGNYTGKLYDVTVDDLAILSKELSKAYIKIIQKLIEDHE